MKVVVKKSSGACACFNSLLYMENNNYVLLISLCSFSIQVFITSYPTMDFTLHNNNKLYLFDVWCTCD